MAATSISVKAPEGIRARLLWDPQLTPHDKRRLLVKEIIAAQRGCEPREVRVEREGPKNFGTHRRLIASISGREIDLNINTASYKGATLVAVSEPALTIGVDVRDYDPDAQTLALMRSQSHLSDEDNVRALVDHWTRVMAVIDAEGRTAWMRPDRVRLDANGKTGWVQGTDDAYTLSDASRGTWVMTFATAAA